MADGQDGFWGLLRILYQVNKSINQIIFNESQTG